MPFFSRNVKLPYIAFCRVLPYKAEYDSLKLLCGVSVFCEPSEKPNWASEECLRASVVRSSASVLKEMPVGRSVIFVTGDKYSITNTILLETKKETRSLLLKKKEKAKVLKKI